MKSILAIDVGGGTQDILLYEPGVEMENNIKLVLPSPTQIIAKRIRRLTREGKDIYLHGFPMGGGASTGAVKKHLEAGCRVYATPQAALTIKDNLDKVTSMGVQLVENAPPGSMPVELKDIDTDALQSALLPFEVKLPEIFALAVQDHGFSPNESNRRFRFTHWEKFLSEGGYLSDLAYTEATLPSYFTRMKAALESCRKTTDNVWLMDTGSAAIMGALEDPKVKEATEAKSALLVNMGNQHAIAFLLSGNRVYGVFEHHTRMLSPEKLADYLKRFARGELTNTEVFEDHGHGCAILPEASQFSFDFIAVTGPHRNLASSLGYLAVPHGDMMLSGPFGLVKSVRDNLTTESQSSSSQLNEWQLYNR